ncbi:MAG: undecaprenyl phosphate translocase family protein, partial [Aquiluna sp.]
MITNLLRGFVIGIAEVIPGVSGGTIALIVGIYERIIGSAASAV